MTSKTTKKDEIAAAEPRADEDSEMSSGAESPELVAKKDAPAAAKTAVPALDPADQSDSEAAAPPRKGRKRGRDDEQAAAAATSKSGARRRAGGVEASGILYVQRDINGDIQESICQRVIIKKEGTEEPLELAVGQLVRYVPSPKKPRPKPAAKPKADTKDKDKSDDDEDETKSKPKTDGKSKVRKECKPLTEEELEKQAQEESEIYAMVKAKYEEAIFVINMIAVPHNARQRLNMRLMRVVRPEKCGMPSSSSHTAPPSAAELKAHYCLANQFVNIQVAEILTLAPIECTREIAEGWYAILHHSADSAASASSSSSSSAAGTKRRGTAAGARLVNGYPHIADESNFRVITPSTRVWMNRPIDDVIANTFYQITVPLEAKFQFERENKPLFSLVPVRSPFEITLHAFMFGPKSAASSASASQPVALRTPLMAPAGPRDKPSAAARTVDMDDDDAGSDDDEKEKEKEHKSKKDKEEKEKKSKKEKQDKEKQDKKKKKDKEEDKKKKKKDEDDDDDDEPPAKRSRTIKPKETASTKAKTDSSSSKKVVTMDDDDDDVAAAAKPSKTRGKKDSDDTIKDELVMTCTSKIWDVLSENYKAQDWPNLVDAFDRIMVAAFTGKKQLKPNTIQAPLFDIISAAYPSTASSVADVSEEITKKRLDVVKLIVNSINERINERRATAV